jgi:hypothetical protein
MALVRGAAARWWSLRSLGAPSRIVARLTTAEFHPTAAPRRSGLGAHDERVVSSICLHPHARDDVSDGDDSLSCAERRASRGVGAVAAVTTRSFQITPHSLSSARPAPTPTGTDTPLPPRWPASVGRGRWMSSSTSAPRQSSGNRVRSSTIFVEGRDHGGGDENRRTKRVRDGYRAAGGDGGAGGGGGRGYSGGGSSGRGRGGRGGTKNPRLITGSIARAAGPWTSSPSSATTSTS